MSTTKPSFAKFCALEALHWAVMAAVQGLMSTYMSVSGMPDAVLSTVQACYLTAAFAGALFWGGRIDEAGSHRRFFVLGVAASMVTCVATCLLIGNYLLCGVAYAAYGFMVAPVATNLDAWVMDSFPERADAAGRARSFATGGYAHCMLLYGQLIKFFGYGVIWVAACVAVPPTIALALTQPDAIRAGAKQKREKVGPAQVASLMRIPPYALLVVVVFLNGFAISPLNYMRTVVLQNVGADVSYIGFDSFVGCLAQLPFLVFSGYWLRFPKERRLLAGIALPFGYAVLTAFCHQPVTSTLAFMLNNTSFGILYPSMREITRESVPEELFNSASSLIDVCYGQLPGIISLLAAGPLLSVFGIRGLSFACAAAQAVTLAVLVAGMARLTAQQAGRRRTLVANRQ